MILNLEIEQFADFSFHKYILNKYNGYLKLDEMPDCDK